MKRHLFAAVAGAFIVGACAEPSTINAPEDDAALPSFSAMPGNTGVVTANGWYEEDEIYYILGGIEEGIDQRGSNQIYFIGGDRAFQANVVLHIPGERGYSPHWNVNEVHTADGVTVQDIIDAGLASDLFGEEPVLFDDAEDIVAAADMGLVVLTQPGVVVLCPIIAEEGAEAPGNTELPEDEFLYEFDVNSGF